MAAGRERDATDPEQVAALLAEADPDLVVVAAGARPRMAAIEERFADGEITKLDGISVDYDDWHFNVRPSNTEPLLRLNLESLVSKEDMERRRDEVLQLIHS